MGLSFEALYECEQETTKRQQKVIDRLTEVVRLAENIKIKCSQCALFVSGVRGSYAGEPKTLSCVKDGCVHGDQTALELSIAQLKADGLLEDE